jgi:hypothetical protein
MKEIFSVEETNLMCIFDTKDKAALLAELRESLPSVYDPDMRDIYESAILKLEKISDDEFSGIGLYIADDDYENGEV